MTERRIGVLRHLSLMRVRAMARKEFIHIIRDPFSLGMALGLPVMMLVLFGFALTLDVDRVPLVVWDQDGTTASRDLVSRFSGSRFFSLRRAVWGYQAISRAFDTREALVALVVPYGFARDVETSRPAQVQVIVDGSDANTGTIALGYAEAVVLGYQAQVTLDASRRRGLPPVAPAVDERPRVWFNADLESRNFIIPGLMAVILMVIAALLTSLTVAREWERGTMEQLVSTPVKGLELIVGKLIPYFAISGIDLVLAVVMAEYVFHVPFRGSLVLLFATAAIFIAGTLSAGMLISVSFRNQMLASQVAILSTFLPAFLLSGFMFSITNSPKAVRMLSYLVPARYFVDIIRAIYLKGTGLREIWPDTLLLAAFGVLMFALANARFAKKIA